MCTVTFIPVKDKFFLTSNRDEKILRQPAFPPAVYWVTGGGLLYPKDAEAGGSWIGLHESGHAAVLLNGAFKKHISQPPYRHSRGIIFLEIIAEEKPVLAFTKINLNNIEPFTIIIFENNCLYECRWDGQQKYCVQLKNYRPYIWSSATLYQPEVVQKREKWFMEWLNKIPNPSQDDILQFHQFTGDGDITNNLVMNRDGKMLTVSVTGIELDKYAGKMQYIDLMNNHICLQQLDFGILKKVA
jgi:hypothetical protein